jgi:hypothetical protein
MPFEGSDSVASLSAVDKYGNLTIDLSHCSADDSAFTL